MYNNFWQFILLNQTFRVTVVECFEILRCVTLGFLFGSPSNITSFPCIYSKQFKYENISLYKNYTKMNVGCTCIIKTANSEFKHYFSKIISDSIVSIIFILLFYLYFCCFSFDKHIMEKEGVEKKGHKPALTEQRNRTKITSAIVFFVVIGPSHLHQR